MDTRTDAAHVRRVEPLATDWRSAPWGGGVFDTARRGPTSVVEGTIRTPHHLLLVTLRGGAERLDVRADCGHRYEGKDRPGAVSFVPAHRERRLRMLDVRAEWATLSFRPEFVDEASLPDAQRNGGRVELAPFTNVEDSLLSGIVGELRRHLDADGSLDPIYSETMGLAAARYLARRFGRPSAPSDPAAMRLAPWQLRRVADFISAQIGGEIRIADLAALAGVSVGHFHRAFRTTMGQTPLAYMNEARVRRAVAILATENLSVAELALRVGFVNPGYFARVFRRSTGVQPSIMRRR